MKNKKSLILLVPALSLFYLAGCGSGSNEPPTIKLANANTRLIGTLKINPLQPTVQLPETFANMNIAKLPTYQLSNKGDVPYVEVQDLVSALNVGLATVISGFVSYEVKEDGAHIYSDGKKGEVVLNAETDVVKLKNGQTFSVPNIIDNNGVSGDYCSFRGASIKESNKTKVYKIDGSAIVEYTTYNFKAYGFDVVKQEGKYYVPFEAVTKIMYRDIGLDFAFNGSEYYLTQLGSFTSSLINSSKGYWSAYSGIYAPDKVGDNEAYRFHFTYERLKDDGSGEKEVVTKFMVLNNNDEKSGYVILCPGETFDPTRALPDVESNYTYTWKVKDQILTISVKSENEVLGEYGIHLDETRFLKSTVSKEMSEYNYNILKFMFDHLYGLKEQKNIASAESYFKDCGVNNDLKSTNIKTYNAALSKLIGKVDDGHSNHTKLSVYTAYDDLDSLNNLRKQNVGPRVLELGEKNQKYQAARIAKYAELHPEEGGNADPNYYHGIKFSSNKETAIITFDSFIHNANVIKNMKELFPNDEEVDEIGVRAKMIFSSADGFSAAFQMLKHMNKNGKVVKNVVVDLTNNGGGMIATMPYLTAFWSDDPTYVLKDTTNNTIREYHYQIDLNGDGTFGGAGDTFKNDFNFYFLTSGFSFSCGNCLPGMAKDSGVKIIGEKSGGGVSPVGVYYDALGSGINISNHYNMMYKGANGNYIQNDDGIALDYEFAFNNGNWYDPNAVQTFVKSIQN